MRFLVTKRSVRDHLKILIKRYRKKMNAEERSTVLSPEPIELDQALADIIEMDEDTDKQKAESIRKMAMEKLGETKKRTGKPYEEKEKEWQ
ncbi:PREDICTED: uncharacterized protein LOC107353857 [Acropora digitifera]|uniref:uncharacterized protein LOC107353857 n=1 Tax=Acropora digitifera TaxID=70779 RepID=UPI00077AF824|nr:PREDICTED: uncharacterized protein LOC107353857 [Acropora digitifera]